MIDLQWLTDRMVEVLRWQIAHPGADDPDAPDVPLAGRRVWSAFLALHAARGVGGFGPGSISNSEIEAYGRVQREPMRPFEVEIIRTLDLEWMKAAAEKAAPKEDPTPQMSGDDVMGFFRKKQVVSQRPLTPALFDALFPGE